MKATGQGVVCPGCGSPDTGVKDSRSGEGCIRRRRHCNGCGQRFSTVEIAVSEAGPAERASALDPVERAMRLRASIDAIPEKPRDAIFELIRQLSAGSTS